MADFARGEGCKDTTQLSSYGTILGALSRSRRPSSQEPAAAVDLRRLGLVLTTLSKMASGFVCLGTATHGVNERIPISTHGVAY